MNSTGIIIGMATLTVASAVTQRIMISIGESDKAQVVNFATTSGLVITSLTMFAKVIKALSGL